MNNQKQDLQKKEEAPKSIEGAKGSAWKRLLAKKWVFPATYIAAAAIILTLMWVYQDSGKSKLADNMKVGLDSSKQTVTNNVSGPDALPANTQTETMSFPFKDRGELDVSLPYFDSKASNEVRQAALVEYGDTFTPHVGIDYARHDDKPFDVMAAMSGKVTAVEKNPVVGNLVEITHSNGLVTVYQSLADVKVAKDQQVKKGDVIAQAGRNDLEKEEGVHLHFEVRQGQGGAALNPEQFFPEH
ncbi:M23 family metallopeptidase [Paenibacillus thalictri]|uniref:M23 family metallopeptidase n=1 Tax=Paenibacillus thalictri TaxID=2527873 RepID=A0A4Q9DIF4_9BACL|nr:M23 family metallopeptidase [Paenibacillus thalictri]TBL72969.1 M23 family metallopeptidase [Paenibacillus thalictri]